MRGCTALELGAWHVADPGSQTLILDQRIIQQEDVRGTRDMGS